MDDQIISIEDILHGVGTPVSAMIKPAKFDGNLAFARSAPYVEQAWRDLRAAWERVEAGAPQPGDETRAEAYPFLLISGPDMARKMDWFEPPKAAKTKEQVIPTWIDALKPELARACYLGVVDRQADIVRRLVSGDIKSQGVPVGLFADDGSNLLAVIVQHQTGADYRSATFDGAPAFPGVSDFMKGKTAGLAFGWYSNPHRSGPKAKDTPPKGTPEPTAEAPAEEAEAAEAK